MRLLATVVNENVAVECSFATGSHLQARLWSDRTSRNRPPASVASGVEAARSLQSASLRTGLISR
jgi:hypothetical protein